VHDFEFFLGIFVVLLGVTMGFTSMGLLTHLFIQSARRERRHHEALRSQERILVERMDVLKTAIAMGFDRSQLDELDQRLEKLIGGDRLARLLAGQDLPAAQAGAGLPGDEIENEIERLAALRGMRSSS
jgi:hypothetical protein